MLPSTMKAAVIHTFGQPLQIEDRPVKRPGNNQLLVKVIASGVCHTDLHAASGDWPVKPTLPLIPGHEAIGYVAAVGAQVSLPPGSFDLPIFETVLNRYTVRGSIVGTRQDLQEAIDFAVAGRVKATIHTRKLDDINAVFEEMKKGEIQGRIVMEIAKP